jgi:hypothetical protein
MAPSRLPRELLEQVLTAVNNAIRAGYRTGGIPSAISIAAQGLNLEPYMVRDRLRILERRYGVTPDPEPLDFPAPEFAPVAKPRVIVRASSASRPEGDPIRLTVIGDCHIEPGQDLSRFKWFARHVAETKPDRVIQIGDLADLHSVSGHEKPGSAQQKAKPSFQQDLEATEEALALYRKEMPDGPPLHICEGNHEDRLDRWDSQVAETSGVLRMQWDDLMARYNLRQTPYRGYLFIGGCAFTHVPMTLMERPFNGRTLNPIVNDLVYSCVWGHSHRFAYLTAPKIGPSQSIEALNVGCAAPYGWYPHYNVSEQGGYTWGIVECAIHGGHIISHRFIGMVDLESKYGD